jgi:esterase/lipase superfamily enzyme
MSGKYLAGRLAAIGVTAAMLASCATTRGSYPVVAPPPPVVEEATSGPSPEGVVYTTVKVFYATDRAKLAPASSGQPIRYGSERSMTVDYGAAVVSIPPGHKRGKTERPPSFFGIQWRAEDARRDIVYLSAELLTRKMFIDLLKPKSPEDKAVLVFIHGYNVSFDDAIRRTGQLARDLAFPGQVMLFSWPSSGSFLSYVSDANSAQWAAPDLAQLLLDIKKEGKATRIVILAHSMGNQVLSFALQSAVAKDPDLKQMVSNIIMAAPDIDVDIFDRLFAPSVLAAAKTVTMYTSSRDRALGESAKLGGQRRVGDTRSGPLVLPPMETIDASLVDTDFLGHSYVSSSPNILDDVSSIVDDGTPASRRKHLVPKDSSSHQAYWQLEPSPSE